MEYKVSVYQRTDSPVYWMQYRDERGSKKRRSTGVKSRRKADRKAAQWEKELREGTYNDGGRILWDDFRKRYEDEVLPGLAEATARKVDGVFNRFEKIAKPKRVRDITPDMLSQYHSALRSESRSESTIRSHLAHLRSALSWAHDLGLVFTVPKFPKTHRAKASKVMKGRPITAEEFERMLDAVEKVIRKPNLGRKKEKPPIDHARLPSWKHFLRGLWLSGLRTKESLDLTWDETGGLRVDFTCRHPMLRIDAEAEKGHKDRLLPMAPEFAQFLEETPERERRGYVFNPAPQCGSGRLGKQQIERVVQAVGEKANVVVDRQGTESPKFASAHDLRRSFGSRWSERVMPQVLMELMRHESIETTLKYYVGQNAQRTAAILWSAAPTVGHNSGTVANSGEAEERQTQEK